MGEPLQLIYLDPSTNQFKIDKEKFEDMLKENFNTTLHDLPVAIVSITGDCRKGKSFLLNYILRYLQRYDQENWVGREDEPLNGFKWKDGVNVITKGIIIWSKPLVLKRSDGSKIVVILMDTQGLFDDNTHHQLVEQLYRISPLVSSIQIHNQVRNIQSNHVDILSKFSETAAKCYTANGSKPFQKLVLLVRDWPNRNEFNYGFEGGRKFLCYKKQSQSGLFSTKWAKIEECYTDIDCFLMPSPGDVVEDPQFKGEVNKLKADFGLNLVEFIQSTFSADKIVTKSLNGKPAKFWQALSYFLDHAKKLTNYEMKPEEQSDPVDSQAYCDSKIIENAFLRARRCYLDAISDAIEKEIDTKQAFDTAEQISLAIFDEDTVKIESVEKSLAKCELIKFLATFRSKFAKSGFRNFLGLAFETLYGIKWDILLGAGSIAIGIATALLKR